MKILVIGAGTVGTTYSYLLDKAGHEMTHYVRKEKSEYYEKNGIPLDILDKRGWSARNIKTSYKPKIVDSLTPLHEYGMIIASVRPGQIDTAARLLKENMGNAVILFLQTIDPDDLKAIQNILKEDEYIIGFPKAGGERKDNIRIDPVLSKGPIILGETGGGISAKLKRIKNLFKSSKIDAGITKGILYKINSRRAMKYTMAAMLGAYLSAGSYEEFCKTPSVKNFILAVREVLNIYINGGKNLKNNPIIRIFNFPVRLTVPSLRIILKSKTGKKLLSAFDAEIAKKGEFLTQSKASFNEILESGRRINARMPVFSKFVPFIDAR